MTRLEDISVTIADISHAACWTLLFSLPSRGDWTLPAPFETLYLFIFIFFTSFGYYLSVRPYYSSLPSLDELPSQLEKVTWILQAKMLQGGWRYIYIYIYIRSALGVLPLCCRSCWFVRLIYQLVISVSDVGGRSSKWTWSLWYYCLVSSFLVVVVFPFFFSRSALFSSVE